ALPGPPHCCGARYSSALARTGTLETCPTHRRGGAPVTNVWGWKPPLRKYAQKGPLLAQVRATFFKKSLGTPEKRQKDLGHKNKRESKTRWEFFCCYFCPALFCLRIPGLVGRPGCLAGPGSFVKRKAVPDTHGAVAGAGNQPRPVGAPGDGMHVVGVAA